MWRIIIIILLIFCFVGTELSNKITPEDMENITKKISYDNLNVSTNLQKEANNQNNTFIVRLVYKSADVLGFAAVEGARVAINFGYRNPQYNFNLMWKLMFISAFAFCILPSIYVLLFIGYGVYIIVNWIKKRTEVRMKILKDI